MEYHWFGLKLQMAILGLGCPAVVSAPNLSVRLRRVVRCSTEGKVGSTDCPLSCPPLVLHISTASSTSSLQTGPLCMNTVCVEGLRAG